jgi:hypothetical protein
MDSRVAEPRAGSFMKTLKLEAVYKMGYKTFEDVTPIFHGSSIKSTTPIVPLARISELTLSGSVRAALVKPADRN